LIKEGIIERPSTEQQLENKTHAEIKQRLAELAEEQQVCISRQPSGDLFSSSVDSKLIGSLPAP
jgi:hypothetical protein